MSVRLIRLEALMNSTSAQQTVVQSGHGSRATTADTAIPALESHAAEFPKDEIPLTSTHEVAHATVSDSNWPLTNVDSLLEAHNPGSVATGHIETEEDYTDPAHEQTSYDIVDAAYSQNQSTTMTATTSARSPNITKAVETALGHCATDLALQENPSLVSDETSNWEYYGPRSLLSIASQPGIEWFESKAQCPGIRQSLHRFARGVTLRFKKSPGSFLQGRCQAPEPAEDIAWSYVRAFFEGSLEADIGIVDQYWFQTSLAEHFRSPKPDRGDPTWFALRFTVYAFGCRISMARNQSYARAVEASVALFENALSVQQDILHGHSSVISVRALLLMASFSEGIGSPHIEYALISNAMRLAIAKGLHCQAASTWRLSQREICQRNQLFWNIYVLDRQISSRSGLPPAIDDDEISCEPPDIFTSGDNISTTFTTISVLLSRIQSQAYRRLSSARARRQSTETLVRAVVELNDKLDSFKQSMKHIISFDDDIDDVQLPSTMTRFQLIMAFFLYYGVLIDIHSSLLVPWFHFTDVGQLDTFRPQIENSCRIVSETARSVILATRLVRLEPNTPVLLALYAPFRSVIMLLVHILSSPGAGTAHSDLMLMGIASGFAHRLNFETNGALNYSFIGEWTEFASTVVQRARPSEAGLAQHGEPIATEMKLSGADAQNDFNAQHLDEGQGFQELFDPSFEGDMALWSTLVSTLSSDDVDMGSFTF